MLIQIYENFFGNGQGGGGEKRFSGPININLWGEWIIFGKVGR